MTNSLLGEIKKQASSFLHDKYKNARLVFTDVTKAELLAEEATNDEPCSPDAKTMTKLAEASLDIDDYWRIADVLHRRLYHVDWKKWRQSYKALVLLEFLLTHGHESFAREFACRSEVIEDLGTFKHKDERGFDWGLNMQKKSQRIIELLQGGDTLKQARLKALKITNEIQGFGNMVSPSASSSSTSNSSRGSNSSGSSLFASTVSSWNEADQQHISSELSPPSKQIIETNPRTRMEDYKSPSKEINADGSRVWECPRIEENENGCLLTKDDDSDDTETGKKPSSFLSGIRAKLAYTSPSKGNGKKFEFRSISDVGRVKGKKLDHQSSLGN